MSTPEIHYRDRVSGTIETERVFGERALPFLYQTRRGRFLVDRLLSRPVFSHLYGLWQRAPQSRKRIRPFAEALGIDLTEAARPLADYRSLDEFFSRRLRPGTRPINRDPDALVSPADGRVFVATGLADKRLAIKGCSVSLAELTADEAIARRYSGGTALVVRLTPGDCHRFHFPDAGFAGETRLVRGPLHSVHPIATSAGAPSLRNKRTVSALETERFGTILLVEVGALVAGSLVQTYMPGRVERGEEKGYFRFGGSTVVMLLEPGKFSVDPDLAADSANGLETLVRMGTRIGGLR